MLVPVVHAMKRARKSVQRRLVRRLDADRCGPEGAWSSTFDFGDPECQPLLMRSADGSGGCLGSQPSTANSTNFESLQWDERPSICVVMASEGYPGDYEKGREITGLDSKQMTQDDGVKVFHAGTKLRCRSARC